VVLTSAFYEQYNNIGWYQFCLGRPSKKWVAAIRQYSLDGKTRDFEEYWMSLLIAPLWRYYHPLWKNRNEQVHKTTVAAQASQMMHAKTRGYYDQYAMNPTMILPCHEYLFTSKTLEQ